MINLNYIKLDENAKDPFKKHITDAGWDLSAVWKKETDKFIEYGTGLAFEIPVGYVGLLFPRSSITKEDLLLKNSVGIIDSDYRGEIRFRFAKYHHDLFSEGNIDVNIENIEYIIDQPLQSYRPWVNANDIAFRKPNYYEVGDRIGQIVFFELPKIKLNLVNELGESERGTGGYGSTGK